MDAGTRWMLRRGFKALAVGGIVAHAAGCSLTSSVTGPISRLQAPDDKPAPTQEEDAPFEFVEIKGPPNKVLTNLHLLSVQGNDSSNPGRVDTSIDLSGRQIGSDGLLIIAAAGHPYPFSSNATVLLAPQMTNSGGALDNGSVSLLLVGAREPILEGTDLDNGNNGTLERLPGDAFIVDAIAWKDAGSSDVIYGGVDLTQSGFTPDAASRFPWDNSPRSASACFVE